MALSMKSQISSDEIDSIEVLRPGTVYVLVGLNGDKLVVKSEAANLTAASFKTTRAAMKQVDTTAADAKLLSTDEKIAINRFAESMKAVIAFMTEHRIPGFSSPAGLNDVLDNFAQNPHALWYKMPLHNVSDLGGALKARVTDGQKNVLKEFAKALSAKGGLEALGKIIACDMFIGNGDRFNPTEGSTMTYGTRTFNFSVIKNIGNVFIAGSGTSRSLTGMDFVDPSTGYRHYDQTLSEVAENYGENWLGLYLVDRRARKEFAKLIIEDLEMILSPNRKPYSPFTKLGIGAASRLDKGMVAGARQILAGLQLKYTNKPAPAGMQSRLNELANVRS